MYILNTAPSQNNNSEWHVAVIGANKHQCTEKLDYPDSLVGVSLKEEKTAPLITFVKPMVSVVNR